MSTGTRPAIAFIGLGRMGLPMASRLVDAGFAVAGADLSAAARAAFEGRGGRTAADPHEAVAGADIVITMLPDGAIVRDLLVGAGGVAAAADRGALIVDMSSSAPLGTVALGEALRAMGRGLVDAPVSGGVRKAEAGTLAIMAGGEAADIARARPAFEAMGASVFATGRLGSGHAMKALNNFVSAAGLMAAAEALIIAERFGLDANVVTDVLNASTGRNNSTEVKLKPHLISGAYASGFSLALMEKDLGTAADLADALGVATPTVRIVRDLWAEAKAALSPDADHTEIHRHFKRLAAAGSEVAEHPPADEDGDP